MLCCAGTGTEQNRAVGIVLLPGPPIDNVTNPGLAGVFESNRREVVLTNLV